MTMTFHTFISSISCLHLPTFRSQAALLSERFSVFTFSYRKSYVTKFDLAVNYVKVNPGSSFEQIMMGWMPQKLHTKFRGNRSTDFGEDDFWRSFTIYWGGSHLGHVTQIPRTNFRSPYPRGLHIKFGFDWPGGLQMWTDDKQTPDHRLRGAKKIKKIIQWSI